MSWSIAKFANDLSAYIKLIEDFNIPLETTKLSALESRINVNGVFNIEVKEIVLHIYRKIAKTNPPGVTKISIYFSNTCEVDPLKNSQTSDPIKSNYYFYYQINGYGNAVGNKEYINCWRLDQNIPGPASKYTHPYYHFQAGGDELQYKSTGDLILLAAPRLPHPPMDLFLGLHFILNNYLSTKDDGNLLALFRSYEYQEIIKRAQKRMWEPYFNCFNPANTNADFTFQTVFPLYLQ